jgi:hypothetical protein
MTEDERIQHFCRSFATVMKYLDTAIAIPAMGMMMVKQGRRELEKAIELCPATIKEKIVTLYDHVKEKEKRRQANAALGE